MPTAVEEKLIDIKFKLDMYYSLADSPESTLEKIEEVINPKVKLNENQQVVLEWLKEGDNSPFAMISTLDDDFVGIDTGCLIPAKVREGFVTLSNIEQFQVLAAFAEWGE